jgi:nicotinamide-nucleotide amidase
VKTAAIITIGNELLSGAVINTNASLIANFIRPFGYYVSRIITVPDQEPAIIEALDSLKPDEELIFVTGGLGPTNDDITRRVVARYFEAQLIFREDIYDHMVGLFAQRGLQLSENNRVQAYFPDNAQLLVNSIGTAPGMQFEKAGRTYFVLPGVPAELETLLQEEVAPRLAGKSRPLPERVYHFFGISESQLYARLQPWIAQHPEVRFTFLPRGIQIDLVLLLLDEQQQSALMVADQVIKQTCGAELFAEGTETMESVVGQQLLSQRLTLAVAESCTGGLIAHRLTNVAGSSNYFRGGVCAYHNSVKTDLLKVSPEILQKYGAVSAETAAAMAKGVRQALQAEVGLSTTGIAGPSGGTSEKPVGLVYIGLALDEAVIVHRFNFHRDRLMNKQLFAQTALDQLRRQLSKRSSV